MTDKCPACGKDMTDHLGIFGTCAKLQLAIRYLGYIANCYGGDPSSRYAQIALEKLGEPCAPTDNVV